MSLPAPVEEEKKKTKPGPARRYCMFKQMCTKTDCKFIHPPVPPSSKNNGNGQAQRNFINHTQKIGRQCRFKKLCQIPNCNFLHPAEGVVLHPQSKNKDKGQEKSISIKDETDQVQANSCLENDHKTSQTQTCSKTTISLQKNSDPVPSLSDFDQNSNTVKSNATVPSTANRNPVPMLKISVRPIKSGAQLSMPNTEKSPEPVQNDDAVPKPKIEKSSKPIQNVVNAYPKSFKPIKAPVPAKPLKPRAVHQERESRVTKVHKEAMNELKERIDLITNALDYNDNLDTNQASVHVLEGKLEELQIQLHVYEAVQSRAYEFPEVEDQISRELFRLESRLSAFTKRLEIEKYLTGLHRFLIVQGQTGSGKSTQIPQYVADHPRFHGKRVICAQPRKIAAISLAKRVSYEYSGGTSESSPYIGFTVGGTQGVGPDCRIEFVTEGILLGRILSANPQHFRDVGCIIIDEAHERSITCDILLGALKSPDPRWKDIQIIATSATIDLNLFSDFFDKAPAVEIEGRMFPVDIIYKALFDPSPADIRKAVASCALEIHNDTEREGDILCFLPGLEDLLLAKSLFEQELRKDDACTFILHGKLDPAEQAAVFETLEPGKRKIVFATDVAETSVTIDGVVFVVDSGVKKEMVFDPRRNISSLKVNTISRSSAIQRAGRAGRTRPGISYRLYSMEEYEKMAVNTAPEIFRRPLSLALLTLREMGIDPVRFDWISSPSVEAVANAERELQLLGAIDATSQKPTELGQLISTCQTDPKLMKMIYAACKKGFGIAGATVAGVMSVSNIFFWNGRDPESKAKVKERRKEMSCAEGDVVTMYRIFTEWLNIMEGRGPNQVVDKNVVGDMSIVIGSSGNAEAGVPNVTTLGDSPNNGAIKNKHFQPSLNNQRQTANDRKKQGSQWCIQNHINGKALGLALAAKNDLLHQLRQTKFWKSALPKSTQSGSPTNTEIQEILCSGYFLNSAIHVPSRNPWIAHEYFALESEVMGTLDYNSSIPLLKAKVSPKWIVYDRILRLPKTIFPVSSPIEPGWVERENAAFYQSCLEKTLSLPTEVVTKQISHICLRALMGRNFSNVDPLENELDCLLSGDLDSGSLTFCCSPIRRTSIEDSIRRKCDEFHESLRSQTVEQDYIGQTRLVLGAGYQVKDILFQNEFSTLMLHDVPSNFTLRRLEGILTKENEKLRSLELVPHNSLGIATFGGKSEAKSAFERLRLEKQLTPRPRLGTRKGVSQDLTCRLKLSWPAGSSTGRAHVFFHNGSDGNNFINGLTSIFPQAYISPVHGMKAGGTFVDARRGNHMNAPLPPLTFIRTPKGQRNKYIFNVDGIRDLGIGIEYQYKVTVHGLPRTADELELFASLRPYNPKQVVVVRQKEETETELSRSQAQSNSDSVGAERQKKLQPLQRFMNPDTVTLDFFEIGSCRAGIHIFFKNNSLARDAYNQVNLNTLGKCFDQPHRLEIEYTHSVSIHADVYKLLKPSMESIMAAAKLRGIYPKEQLPRGNSKFVYLKFHTARHFNINWIQEQMDRITKVEHVKSSKNFEILFSFTGKLELKRLSERTFFHWNHRNHSIWIYGTDEMRERIRNELTRTAERLQQLEVLDQLITLDRRSMKYPGQEKKLASTCNRLVSSHHIEAGIRLYVSGSKASVEALKRQLLAEKISRTFHKQQVPNFGNSPDCQVCYDSPDNNFITLLCGHLYCIECLQHMTNQQPPPFPILCVAEGCGNALALEEIQKFASVSTLQKIMETAVLKFQEQNSEKVQQCPKPACEQFLSYEQRTAGSKGGDFLFCDECVTTYCLVCSAELEKPVTAHEDDSCDDVQSGLAYTAAKHVRVIQDTIFNLKCPQCNTVFFEFDGCAAVSCGTCKGGFCGLCLADCGSDAHSHVKKCTKNPNQGIYFVSKQDLDKVHRGIRSTALQEYMDTKVLDRKTQETVLRGITKDIKDLRIKEPTLNAPELSVDSENGDTVEGESSAADRVANPLGDQAIYADFQVHVRDEFADGNRLAVFQQRIQQHQQIERRQQEQRRLYEQHQAGAEGRLLLERQLMGQDQNGRMERQRIEEDLNRRRLLEQRQRQRQQQVDPQRRNGVGLNHPPQLPLERLVQRYRLQEQLQQQRHAEVQRERQRRERERDRCHIL